MILKLRSLRLRLRKRGWKVSNLPKSTKEGVLNIGSLQLKVFVLDNGQRVIDEESVQNFMKWLVNGTKEEVEKFGKVFGEFMHHGIIAEETKKEGK